MVTIKLHDGDDQITCSAVDSQGNVYFVGYGFELKNYHSGYDWWIKKIDSSGNEVIDGWNKSLGFYANYSSYDSYDKPTKIIIDSDDNLIVADAYNTVKFTPDGNEIWQKSIGGTLYTDSQDNVFIVTSSSIRKYDPAGTLLWTKAYTGKLAFDNADNILVNSGEYLRHLSPTGIWNWGRDTGELDTTIVDVNGWYNDTVDDLNTIHYYKFDVVNGEKYLVFWNDRYGDGTKTGYIGVSAFWENEARTSIFGKATSGWDTPKTFTATATGTVIIKVEPFSTPSSYYGTYALQVNDWYNTDDTDDWYNSSLSIGGSEEYVVPVSEGTRYFVAWNSKHDGNGTKTGDVEVSAYWQDGGSSIFTTIRAGWTNPKLFTASKSGNIVIKIKTYSSTSAYAGTYAVTVQPVSSLTSSGKIIPSTMTVNSAVFDNNGYVYSAGYGNRLLSQYSKNDVWIKKYDSSGNEVLSGWNKKYDWGHGDDESAANIKYDGTNIIVIGQGNDLVNGSSKNDTWIKKYTEAGTELYAFTIPDNNATLLKIDSSENYYFSSGSSTSALFKKYNQSGALLNSFSWNTKPPYMNPPLFIMDNANNVYMFGYSSNLITTGSGNDWIIRKFNSDWVEQ